MSELKHSPSPWNRGFENESVITFEDAEGNEIGSIRPQARFKRCKITEANLAVVLAAPKLLAALKDMEALFWRAKQFDEHEGRGETYAAEMEVEIRQLIAEAEGTPRP